MILNGNDFARTRVRISMLKGRCDRLRRRIADPRQAKAAQAEIATVENRIVELSEQIRTYLRLLNDCGTIPEVVTLIDVPDTLIQRRIRLGMSQADLGEASGQTRQCISRYERTLYASVSLARLIQIDSLLRAEEVRLLNADSQPMVVSL